MRAAIERIGDATLYLGDCREILPELERVDACVTDPPYGIAMARRGTIGTSKNAEVKNYGKDEWDNQPISDALLRDVMLAGRWNIIFGGNYYPLPATSCWLVWDKLNSGDFADCELAWTNLPKAVRRLQYLWNGMIKAPGETRGDHPTQKPVGVMSWCLQQLPDGTKSVIDPFMGSGTTGVACAKAGMRFIGIEREPQYFAAACRRIEEAYRQPRLFEEPKPKAEQLNLLSGDAT
jgi:DNA modification methylase